MRPTKRYDALSNSYMDVIIRDSPLHERNMVNTFCAVAVSLSRYAAPFPYASVKPDRIT
jgi:hypothetical protein